MSCAVILTAIRVEYMAVRAHLSDLTEEMHPNGTIYERGKFSIDCQEWEVAIVETGARNSPAGIEAERAIAYFNPDVILFVRVAGGIKDVQLGDVVAATKVYGYESGKVAETFRPRPDVGLSNYNMIQRARAEARKEDWLARLSDSDKPNVFVAPIARGEKVIANKKSDLFEFLQQNYGDALAVEIEGIGILQAAHTNQQVSALIIRGISSLIDDKSRANKEGSEEVAARHASAFAFEILAKFKSTKNQQTLAKQDVKYHQKVLNFF
ncbi:MAG: 5'-methylthioadenosine/S-adenosylhomocysteine nucleosidase [Okeania sp. SIO3I5]|uniref:5'-methylthioadenosine/S-adenosylhomocysteine nucleosidase family protein n=1 Tax=Okeania sp. SIO3I5 TaxID=2607805 RepID=UPI0013B6AC80|nr:5'-methylthioadenosine/S-adenosylhomocysteine nucleosidase [Okeania sp. SIO3I5]NEQ38127.1 5'-methylthioadenosine/S-adenosylhomocysteine nucleosidase [Okeania sp. SIO3I5]